MACDKQFVACLIKEVLLGNIAVSRALSKFPKNSNDKSIDCAFFALTHLEADEDIRLRDSNYREEQDDYLLMIAQTLEKNEDLPLNILREYSKYYDKPPIYQQINLKYVLNELKKFINF